MNSEPYLKARKLGERSYRQALSRDEYPYLQVLEEILSHENTTGEIDLGVVDIPLVFVKGTYTAGRRTAFAPNFMPLLPLDTEFSDKWIALNHAHEEEGIHDPIVAYEYMHNFYVVEGNKRVSVLKFNEASSIRGRVTRIIPVKNDSRESRVYFEYLQFYRSCPVLFLIFTEPGSYKEFCHFVGKKMTDKWSDDEITELKSVFYRFKKAYHELSGGPIRGFTTADAFLSYLHSYSYQDSLNKYHDDFKRELLLIWDDIMLQTKEEAVELLLDPEEAPKKNILERVFGDEDRKLKAAFIYLRSVEESPWAYGHELGRQHLNDSYQDQVETWSYENISPDEIDQTLQDAIDRGANIIFATSQLYIPRCNIAAAKNPDVVILTCGVNVAMAYMHTYYPRLYEAKYLSGMIAGIMAEGNDIGYLADNPSYGTLSDVNAFALGVQSVKPTAHVHVQWVAEIDSDPAKYFEEHQIQIISGRDILGKNENPREFGLYRFHDGKIENLALAMINWGAFYKKMTESVLNGAYLEVSKDSEGRAVNYWWGLKADVVDLILSDKIPNATQNLVEFTANSIRNGSFSPFSGLLTTNDGVRITTDKTAILSPKEIESMHWLNENIIGHIPSYKELMPFAKALIRVELDTEGRGD